MIYSTKTRHSISGQRRPHFTPVQRVSTTDTSDGLQSDIRKSLQDQGHGRLGEIDVMVENGSVTLSGNVDTYYQLQLAQTIAMKQTGERAFCNEIVVR